MNQRRRTTIIAAAISLLGLAGLHCFEGTEGEEGHFTFHDLTPEAGQWVKTDQALNRPLAVGARLALVVRDGGQTFTPAEVSSSAPDVIAVESNGEDYLLHARRAGEARVSVRKGEDWDTVTVRSESIAHTEILLFPLGELMSDQDFAADGVVLTPGAKIWGFMEHRSSKGERLTGYGGGACTMDPGGGALFADDGSDRFSIQAPAAETPLTLTCGEAALDLPVRAADSAVRLEAFSYLDGKFGPAFYDVARMQTQYVVLLARDAEGRLVQGAAGEPVTLDIPPDLANYVTERTYEDDSPELQELFASNRVVALDFARTGTYELTASWNGVPIELSFDVVPQ